MLTDQHWVYIQNTQSVYLYRKKKKNNKKNNYTNLTNVKLSSVAQISTFSNVFPVFLNAA